MSENLPATVGSIGRALKENAGGRPVPSSVRKKALRAMPGVVTELRRIVKEPGAGGPKVAAGKLLAEIAAVAKTSSVPRDVVDEKLRQTAALLRHELGDAKFATLADALSAIWDV